MGIRIEGLDDCLRMFDQADDKLVKMSRTALKAGNKAVVKQLKGGVPQRWGRLVKGKVYKLPNGKLAARIGLYNSEGLKATEKGEMPDWFKAYWANYGTLEHRDTSHKFDRPIKPQRTRASKQARMHGKSVNIRRNNSGQKARGFFEGAVVGWEDRFFDAFKDSLKKQEDKLTSR